MGTAYQYRCVNCKYDTFCSSEGDRGFTNVVYPMVCSNCELLMDIVTARYVGDENDPVPEVQLRCTKCRSAEGLSSWDGRTCPRCREASMTNTHSFRMWD